MLRLKYISLENLASQYDLRLAQLWDYAEQGHLELSYKVSKSDIVFIPEGDIFWLEADEIKTELENYKVKRSYTGFLQLDKSTIKKFRRNKYSHKTRFFFIEENGLKQVQLLEGPIKIFKSEVYVLEQHAEQFSKFFSNDEQLEAKRIFEETLSDRTTILNEIIRRAYAHVSDFGRKRVTARAVRLRLQQISKPKFIVGDISIRDPIIWIVPNTGEKEDQSYKTFQNYISELNKIFKPYWKK